MAVTIPAISSWKVAKSKRPRPRLAPNGRGAGEDHLSHLGFLLNRWKQKTPSKGLKFDPYPKHHPFWMVTKTTVWAPNSSSFLEWSTNFFWIDEFQAIATCLNMKSNMTTLKAGPAASSFLVKISPGLVEMSLQQIQKQQKQQYSQGNLFCFLAVWVRSVQTWHTGGLLKSRVVADHVHEWGL